jgi:hypothetical protein
MEPCPLTRMRNAPLSALVSNSALTTGAKTKVPAPEPQIAIPVVSARFLMK